MSVKTAATAPVDTWTPVSICIYIALYNADPSWCFVSVSEGAAVASPGRHYTQWIAGKCAAKNPWHRTAGCTVTQLLGLFQFLPLLCLHPLCPLIAVWALQSKQDTAVPHRGSFSIPFCFIPISLVCPLPLVHPLSLHGHGRRTCV